MIRSMVLMLSLVTVSFVPLRSAEAPQLLPIIGGSGGTSFSRNCGTGRVLTGLQYRSGLVVDAVSLLCRTVRSDGTLGSQSAIGSAAGGSGGSGGIAQCDAGTVVMGAQIFYGSYVNGVVLRCRTWGPAKRKFGDQPTETPRSFGSLSGSSTAENCELNTQPAVAIRGRAHSLVDAIGLTCNEP